jgi:hypothetical protein
MDGGSARLVELTDEALATALGRDHRDDPVAPRTGGPAGNARLTAWTGLALLVLFVAELVTLLDVRGWIGWHVALGVLLIPPAVLKTVTTGWRIVRYYVGDRSYRTAGPPPMLLRLLGPLVVASTLALLGSGLALILLGEGSSRSAIVSVAGQRVDWITLHQASFAVWCVATGLHVLVRLLPAVQLTVVGAGRIRVPGQVLRGLVLVLTALVAAVSAWFALGSADSWRHEHFFGHFDDGQGAPPAPGAPAQP